MRISSLGEEEGDSMVMRKGLGNSASSLQILSSGGVVDALADRNNNVSSVEEILWRKWMLRSKLQDQREQAGADKRWREVRITRIYGHFQDSANTSWVPRMAKCLPKHRRKKNKDCEFNGFTGWGMYRIVQCPDVFSPFLLF